MSFHSVWWVLHGRVVTCTCTNTLQVYDAGEHFMMSPLGEGEEGRGLYKVVTATEEGVKQNEPNKYVHL